MPSPEDELKRDIIKLLRDPSVPPQFAYAYKKTGLLGLLEDKSAWAPEDVKEWNDAIDEYFDGEPSDDDEVVGFSVSLETENEEEAKELSKKIELSKKMLDPHNETDRGIGGRRKNPAFKGEYDFDITFELFGQKHTETLQARYGYTPEWEYYDLKKKAPFTGWAGSTLSLHVLLEYEDSEEGPKKEWERVTEMMQCIPHEIWENLYDAIDDKCKEEDRERRTRAGNKKPRSDLH